MAKRVNKVTNPQQILQQTFADKSGVVRQSESGLDWTPKGAAGSAVRVGPGCPILCYNSIGTVGFVTFGVQSMAAPTGPTDGIPILPNSTFVINSGDLEWVRASAATIFVFTGDNI